MTLLSLSAAFLTGCAATCCIMYFFQRRKTGQKHPSGVLPNEYQIRRYAVGELLTGVIHELNQPLCVLQGYLELLVFMLKNKPDMESGKMEDSLRSCTNSVDRIHAVLTQFRNFAISASSQKVRINPQKFLSFASNFCGEQLSRHRIHYSTSVADPPVSLLVSPEKFELLLVLMLIHVRNFLLTLDAEEKDLGVHVLRGDRKNGVIIGVDGTFRRQAPENDDLISRWEEEQQLFLSSLTRLAKESGGDLTLRFTQDQIQLRLVFPTAGNSD